jgi:hypothetical protein
MINLIHANLFPTISPDFIKPHERVTGSKSNPDFNNARSLGKLKRKTPIS